VLTDMWRFALHQIKSPAAPDVRHSTSGDQFTLDRKPARTVRLWLSASMRWSMRPTCCAS